jgi:hypothetical protein
MNTEQQTTQNLCGATLIVTVYAVTVRLCIKVCKKL